MIHHIAFNCVDRERQERFYTTHFGFRRARVLQAGQPGEFIMLRKGDCCLELFPVDAGAAASPGEQAVGFKHLALEVDDIEAKERELKAAGVDIDPIVDASGEVPGLRVCFFRDPEGNVIEIMQGWRDENEPGLLGRSARKLRG